MADTLVPTISVQGMTKRFDGRTVVNGISLEVNNGEIFGFLGPNGSGKTTFLRMLCGLLKPDAGAGTCLGYDVITDSELIKYKVGYMTQSFSLYVDLSIVENLDFIARVYGISNRKEAVEKSLERLGLVDRQKQLVGELSGGWKQRLSLAACLIHQPQLLLLDEPTAGVDPKARREFWDDIHNLAGQGLTILITTHYMDEAERCHRLGYIMQGNLLAYGTVSEVIEQARLSTWEIFGPRLSELEAKLRGFSVVEQVVFFGNTLRVSGTERDALAATLAAEVGEQYRYHQIQSGMEDVFIHLMREVKEVMS